MARFLEILRCNGVDETARPYPGIVVPFRGENQVVLETFGDEIDLQPGGIELDEIRDETLVSGMLRGIRDELSKPDVDPQQKDAFMPNVGWQQPRFIRVRGTHKTGSSVTLVKASPKPTRQRRASSAVATLQVAVVDQMVVKVAIRNVRARDSQGNWRYHAKRPADPATVIATMNAIWRPQTNIVFELVPSGDVDIDHDDPKTRDELTKAYGMKSPATFSPESMLWADKNWGPFAKHKVPGTHMTFFVVHKLLSGGHGDYGRGGEFPNGVTDRPTGLVFIADSRLASTFAHEAGHYIGDMHHDGDEIKLLMRGEGAGYKIPFKLAKHFRESLAKRRVA